MPSVYRQSVRPSVPSVPLEASSLGRLIELVGGHGGATKGKACRDPRRPEALSSG